MKPTRTWVLIADGARARILQQLGPGRDLTAIDGMVFHGDHAATHDLVSDREGRSFSSHGPGRSAYEPHTDPHRDLKAKFAHQLADILARGLEQKFYDRLVILSFVFFTHIEYPSSYKRITHAIQPSTGTTSIFKKPFVFLP